MSFASDIPDWKSYNSDKYHMSDVPDAFWGEFNGISLRAATSTDDLKSIINHMAEIVPTSPTGNWGGDFLRNDLREMISKIATKVENGKMPVLMDCLAILVDEGDLICDEINELLEENKIGYECGKSFSGRVKWSLREGIDSRTVDTINATQESVKSVSVQAYEEFERAKASLESASDERARKDAVSGDQKRLLKMEMLFLIECILFIQI